MTKRKIAIIDGGSAQCWGKRKEGFRLIHEAERAAEQLADAPIYLHGGFDEDGDVIAVGNLGLMMIWRVRSRRSRRTRRR